MVLKSRRRAVREGIPCEGARSNMARGISRGFQISVFDQKTINCFPIEGAPIRSVAPVLGREAQGHADGFRARAEPSQGSPIFDGARERNVHRQLTANPNKSKMEICGEYSGDGEVKLPWLIVFRFVVGTYPGSMCGPKSNQIGLDIPSEFPVGSTREPFTNHDSQHTRLG